MKCSRGLLSPWSHSSLLLLFSHRGQGIFVESLCNNSGKNTWTLYSPLFHRDHFVILKRPQLCSQNFPSWRHDSSAISDMWHLPRINLCADYSVFTEIVSVTSHTCNVSQHSSSLFLVRALNLQRLLLVLNCFQVVIVKNSYSCSISLKMKMLF